MKIYREIVRNLTMGIQAIENLDPYVDSENLKRLMSGQAAALDKLMNKAKPELTTEELEDAKGSKFEKTMLKAGVKMNAMFNGNSTHIASMLIEGYNMGIESVQKCVNELKRDGNQIPPLASEVMSFYDKSIKALREYL